MDEENGWNFKKVEDYFKNKIGIIKNE